MAGPRGVNLCESGQVDGRSEMTAREYEVATRPDIVFAEHDGVTLLGDLYLPTGLARAPVLLP
jgi:hypothetical protein